MSLLSDLFWLALGVAIGLALGWVLDFIAEAVQGRG